MSLRTRRVSRLRTNEAILSYAFILPSVVFLAAFMFYPVVDVIVTSLFKTNEIGAMVKFVGLSNYVKLFKENVFDIVILRSFIWTIAAVLVKTILGLIIAILLLVKFRGRKIARTLFLIPWASSAPVGAIIWVWVLNPQFGLLDRTLTVTGLWPNPPDWLGAPFPSFVSTLWVDVWLGIPFMALVFLAAMQSVSKDLYEAGDVEGANSIQKFFHITLPSIRPVLLIATLLSTLWTFNDFSTIWIMTKGGPAGFTHILVTYLYEQTFSWSNWSAGSAMAVMTFVILSIVAWIYAASYFRKGEQE